MIWRIANAFREGEPINFDRVLGASYNTRSAFEALIAHTPQFYWCYPGRTELMNAAATIQKGHKHLIWIPSEPHKNGTIEQFKTDMVVSEVPLQQAVYDSLSLPSAMQGTMDIDQQRRHVQIQIALVMIANHFNYGTWIANNDRGIIYQGKPLYELDGVINRLSQGTVIQYWGGAVEAAKLIDIIWFSGDKEMPAVIEVEHTTGVTSGLSRMKELQDKMPAFPTKFVIAAPDEDRNDVLRKIRKHQFSTLDARYLPYSAVEELWILCTKRNIQGVNAKFFDSYMEKVL
jgi:type II restriction enzyme